METMPGRPSRPSTPAFRSVNGAGRGPRRNPVSPSERERSGRPPKVAILLGSKSDMPVAEKAAGVLNEAGVPYDLQVISAHREPAKLDAYLRRSRARVFICIAGLSAALPGAVAARVRAPVIGVPVSAKMGGLDALLSTAQMPPGVPVAAVGVDNGANAAHLALRILGVRKSKP